MGKKAQADKNIISGILIGSVAALLITVLLTLLSAVLVSSGRVGEEKEIELVAASALIAAAAGTIAAWRKNKSHALIGGISVAAANIILRLILAMFKGEPPAEAFIMITLAALAGGLAAGLIGAMGRKGRRR